MKKFQGKVEKYLVTSGIDADKEFLPESRFPKLVCRDEVSSLLPNASSSLIDFISQQLKIIFLIVVTCRGESDDLLSLMNGVRKSGMTDAHLPIQNIAKNGTCREFDEEIEHCTHDKVLNFFHDGWSVQTAKRFFNDQWSFHSPVFNSHSKPELESHCILPFTWVSGTVEEGHFSQVREAMIHQDHCHEDFELTQIRDKFGKTIKGIRVAAKELKNLAEPGYRVRTSWENEIAALMKISELRNRHFIRLVASFKRGDAYFIALEWADGGNLRKFWETHGKDGTDLDGDQIIAALEQLVGLASALSRLHNTNTNTNTNTKTAKAVEAVKSPAKGSKPNATRRSRPIDEPPAESLESSSLQVPLFRVQMDGSDDGYYTSDDDSTVEIDENWRHGDLKPDNILRFERKESKWLGTLKIGDLGLAKQHMLATSRRDEATKMMYSTLQYEAPEAITNMNLNVGRSRRFDIWSMGCIILEFTIWLLYNWEGLQNFYDQRNYIDTSTETLYFIANKQSRTASVSDCATRWIKHILQNDPECNSPSGSAIGDLVKLVRDRLLVVALPKKDMGEEDIGGWRADASELEAALKSIWGKAVDDEARGGSYFFSRSDRKGVKPLQPRQRRQSVNLLSTKADHNRTPGAAVKNLVKFTDDIHENH